MKYHVGPRRISLLSPSGRALLGAVALALLAACAYALARMLAIGAPLAGMDFSRFAHAADSAAAGLIGGGVLLAILSIAWHLIEPPKIALCRRVRRAVADPSNGNPLCLKENQRVPKVRCEGSKTAGRYTVRLAIAGTTPERVEGAASAISACLTGRYDRYAVVAANADVAGSYIDLRIEDTSIDWAIRANTPAELAGESPYLLRVDRRTAIDLRTSTSILVAGRTRSGKTYGIISLLLQALSSGPDRYGSQIVVIDPKGAELSRLPGVASPSACGDMTAVLDAMRAFNALRIERQQHLNALSEKSGTAAKWWDSGMKISLLFIDEYVACRGMFPEKSQLCEFDNLLRQIVTMGASAGCYAIICIAQPSVGEGGLPSMVRNGCTTRVLFRPTPDDARMMWPDGIANLPSRDYGQGAALFSTTDGEHEQPTPVQFPTMNFEEMDALRRLMKKYGDRAGVL